MLKAKKSGSSVQQTVALEGDINQDADFAALFGDVKGSLEINCGGVASINSVGVKEWISFFNKLRDSGVTLRFVECTSPLVYQMNLVSNFIRANEVISIFVPFLCESCEEEVMKLYSVSDLGRGKQEIPPIACTKCGQPAVFDDLPNMYFNFLARS